MTSLEKAGAWEPVAALILCGPQRVRDSLVAGRVAVRDGRLASTPLRGIIGRQKGLPARLMGQLSLPRA